MRKALFKFFGITFLISVCLLGVVVTEFNYVGVYIQYTLIPLTLISGVMTWLFFKKEYLDDF